MIAVILAAALIVGQSPIPERATWYGARCPEGVVYLGRTDTCSPYVSKKNGGRGGETKWYAAAGWFRYGMTPVSVKITSKTTGRSVILIVKDFCGACRQGRSIIDMSPLGFISLGHGLGKGADKVFVRYMRGGR